MGLRAVQTVTSMVPGNPGPDSRNLRITLRSRIGQAADLGAGTVDTLENSTHAEKRLLGRPACRSPVCNLPRFSEIDRFCARCRRSRGEQCPSASVASSLGGWTSSATDGRNVRNEVFRHSGEDQENVARCILSSPRGYMKYEDS